MGEKESVRKSMPKDQRILFLIPSMGMIPSGKVRVLNYLPYLREYSVNCKVLNYHHPFILKFCERANPKGRILFLFYRITRRLLRYVDVVYQRWTEIRLLFSAKRYKVILIQWEPPSRHFIRRLLKQNPNLVFDYDDAVFLNSEIDINFILAKSKIVIAGSEYLKDYAKTFNENVVVIPSSIPVHKFDLYRNKFEHIQDSQIAIGWIGSQSTLHHLEILKEVFDALAKKYKLQLKLIGVGNEKSPIPQKLNLEIVTIPYYNEEEMIRFAFSFDIGVGPLKEIQAVHGKTGLKVLIYMAAGVPVICSPTGGNLEVVRDGVNGFFASNSEEWFEKLSLLIEDRSLRERLGNEGLSLVRERYTTQHCFKLFYETLKTNFIDMRETR
jgi:glycosyltransferase involved in cell wall biosynthesis